MQDAVIAVGPTSACNGPIEAMDKLAPQHARLQAPVVETVRDPRFPACGSQCERRRKGRHRAADSIVPGRTFDVTAAPMPGGGAVAVLRDLTETERIEKTRRDFIANVSHELRTPLTSIQGYTETLLDSATENDHSREFLEIIRKNATRMSRLTEDLLTLARVESGEQRFDFQPVHAGGTAAMTPCRVFVEMARAQGIELQVEDTAGDSGQCRSRGHPPGVLQSD